MTYSKSLRVFYRRYSLKIRENRIQVFNMVVGLLLYFSKKISNNLIEFSYLIRRWEVTKIDGDNSVSIRDKSAYILNVIKFPPRIRQQFNRESIFRLNCIQKLSFYFTISSRKLPFENIKFSSIWLKWKIASSFEKYIYIYTPRVTTHRNCLS